MVNLPKWVFDVVIELQRWHAEHPTLWQRMVSDPQNPSDTYVRADCGCKALDLVPPDVAGVAALAVALAEQLRRTTEETA